MDSFRKIFFFAGCGEGHGNVGIVAKSLEFVGHFCECIVVTAANFESCVNKDVADVVVACDKAGKESIEGIEIGNIIFIDIDETYVMAYIETKSCTAFDCYYATFAGFNSFFNVVDEVFGFAGALRPRISLIIVMSPSVQNVLSLRERSLTENQSSLASIAFFMSSYPGFPRSANMFFL